MTLEQDGRVYSAEMVENLYSYHPPKGELVGAMHEEVRARFRDLALWIVDSFYESPETALVLTEKLREGMMHMNGYLACEGLRAITNHGLRYAEGRLDHLSSQVRHPGVELNDVPVIRNPHPLE